MLITSRLRSGWYPWPFVWPDGMFGFAYAAGGDLIIEDEAGERARYSVATILHHHLRAACAPDGTVLVSTQPQEEGSELVLALWHPARGWIERRYGVPFGGGALARWEDGAFSCAVARTAFEYERFTITQDGTITSLGMGRTEDGSNSQPFVAWHNDTPITDADNPTGRQSAGCEGVLVTQRQDFGLDVHVDGVTFAAGRGLSTYDPACVGSAERFALTSRTDRGALFEVYTRPHVADPAPPPPPPPDPPVISLFVPGTRGRAPLRVLCSVTTAHATTWRWLLDGVIVQSDGAQHEYVFDVPGTHAVAVRAAGPGGTTQTPPVDITAESPLPPEPEPVPEPPKPIPPQPSPPAVGWYGVTAGFGNAIGADLLAQIKARGWEIVRQDGQARGRTISPAAMIEEIRAAGLRPVLLCTASQLNEVPEGTDVEVLDDADPTEGGLEPSFRVDPTRFAVIINSAMPVARDRRLRVWTGLVGLDAKALAWLAIMARSLVSDAGISVHRYPPGGATRWDASVSGGRDVEIARFKALIGARPWCVGEFGWNQGPIKSFWQRIFGGHSHLTDMQIRSIAQQEFAYWRRHGAAWACWYQLNDGPGRCAQHPSFPADWREAFGLRRSDESWKPVGTR
jgi:PKD repeat protein